MVININRVVCLYFLIQNADGDKKVKRTKDEKLCLIGQMVIDIHSLLGKGPLDQREKGNKKSQLAVIRTGQLNPREKGDKKSQIALIRTGQLNPRAKGDTKSQIAVIRTGQLNPNEKGDTKVPAWSDKDRTVRSA